MKKQNINTETLLQTLNYSKPYEVKEYAVKEYAVKIDGKTIALLKLVDLAERDISKDRLMSPDDALSRLFGKMEC